jgi:hypothetical protein
MKEYVWQFKYCDCIYDSASVTVSIHKTEEGAIKALDEHMKKTEATDFLIENHEMLESHFERFDLKKSFLEKKSIFQIIAAELRACIALKEEIFYPAVSKAVRHHRPFEEAADEQREMVSLLKEIERLNPSGAEEEAGYVEKVKTLQGVMEQSFWKEEHNLFALVDFSSFDQEILAGQMDLWTEADLFTRSA